MESPTYKAEMQKYGTGSDFQRAAQAATAAIQALAGGDIQKAIASGASPYLAQLVKDVTIPKDESKITASDIAANAMAHAVVGAVVAQLSGQAAGAIGASSGELIARAIMADQYPGKTANHLTEEEKNPSARFPRWPLGWYPVWQATAYGRATDAINKFESAIKGHGI
ncbi:hypothetical protein ACR2Q2_14100 [Pectobacterium versatile]|uniref:hypothetical protein n=1 Tax=Pectobacterium versatile TaxID=2488639 RepID=UPI00301A9F85